MSFTARFSILFEVSLDYESKLRISNCSCSSRRIQIFAILDTIHRSLDESFLLLLLNLRIVAPGHGRT